LQKQGAKAQPILSTFAFAKAGAPLIDGAKSAGALAPASAQRVFQYKKEGLLWSTI
jgi:hypothetical protein